MSVILWKEIHDIADAVCTEFELTYGKIVPETRMRVKHFGECRPCDRCWANEGVDHTNCGEKILSIRIHQLNKPNTPLSRFTIIHTLAHELAHLPPGTILYGHGKEHTQLTDDILIFIRDEGYL